MSEINLRFKEFIKAIRPSDGQLKAAKDEMDFLEKHLGDYISGEDECKFIKALRSGSYAKSTILKRHEEGDFDADIGIYLESQDGKVIDGVKALDYIHGLLKKAYKNRTERKPEYDRSKKSSIKVKFEDHPKINIDVVSIESKHHKNIANWGAILRKDGSKRDTSITEHVAFVTDRNQQFSETPFNQMVMIWKWWRNHKFIEQEQDKFSSFFLELYLGKAFDSVNSGFSNNWIKNILITAEWMLRHRLNEPVVFEDPRVPLSSEKCIDPIIVFDPLNKSNNVTHDWIESDKKKFLSAVQEFYEVLTDAHSADEDNDLEEELELLDTVLPRFSDWSEE